MSATASAAPRWRHLTRDEMDGYDFSMYEKTTPSAFLHVSYDYGGWEHPRGEDASMENIHEFVQTYPAGWYWHASERVPHGQEPRQGHGGPCPSERVAKRAAERWHPK